MPSARYLAYIKSPEWQKKREQAFARYGRQCAKCMKTTGPMHVHHRTYRRLGNELLADLVVMCPGCHLKQHQRRPKRRRF